jgi:hypothetical protein
LAFFASNSGPLHRARCDAEIQSHIENRVYHLKIGGLIVVGIAALGLGQILAHVL